MHFHCAVLLVFLSQICNAIELSYQSILEEDEFLQLNEKVPVAVEKPQKITKVEATSEPSGDSQTFEKSKNSSATVVLEHGFMNETGSKSKASEYTNAEDSIFENSFLITATIVVLVCLPVIFGYAFYRYRNKDRGSYQIPNYTSGNHQVL